MLRGVIFGLLIFSATSPALAQNIIVSERPENVTVTIYQQAFALVSETRTLDLPAGQAVIQFRDVSSTLVPQTADVGGLPEAVNERNFDFNLLTPASLIEKSVGENVRIIRTNRAKGISVEETAILRSGPSGVMLQMGDRIEALNCSGLPERLVFDHIPNGLFDTSTLTVRTNVPSAGRYTVTVRYLDTGLDWYAAYVARIAPDDRTLDLSGWITLDNGSDTSFRNAPVNLVAGIVQLAPNGLSRPGFSASARQSLCWPTDINWASYYAVMAGLASPFTANEAVTVTGTSIRGQAPVGANVITVNRNIEARGLGDLKLYPLPESTTVAAQQKKQIQFLDKSAIPFQRIYRFDNSEMEPVVSGDEETLTVSMLLRLQNTEERKLGIPLPAGILSTYVEFSDGPPIPVSVEESVYDTPVGLLLEIAAGTTTDIFIRRRTISSNTLTIRDRKWVRSVLEIAVTNNKPRPVTFEWAQWSYYSEARLVSETLPHTLKNGRPVWTLAMQPGQQIVFRYTMERPQ